MFYNLYFYGTEAKGLKMGYRTVFLLKQDGKYVSLINPWTFRRWRMKVKDWNNVLEKNLGSRGYDQVYAPPSCIILRAAWKLPHADRNISGEAKRAMLRRCAKGEKNPPSGTQNAEG